MKRNELNDIREQIFFQNYENLFNVYKTTEDDYFYNILRKINIPKEINTNYYSEYIVRPGDTWTLLAYMFYDDVKLWWLICSANNIQNPLQFPRVGYKLKILSSDTVQNILVNVRSS